MLPTGTADHFLMMAEPGCCGGCVPNNPLAVIEVIADQPVKLGGGALRLRGTSPMSGAPEGWRYQLRDAEHVPACRAAPSGGEPALLPAGAGDGAGDRGHRGRHAQPCRQSDPGKLRQRIALLDVATPMRQGGLSVVCLGIVGNSPIIGAQNGRMRPVREPKPGELYDFSRVQFAKLLGPRAPRRCRS